MNERFTVTKEHLLLAQRMWVSWWDDEYGAPGIDPKSPYGDSSVELDIAEILGEFTMDDYNDTDGACLDPHRERYRALHESMKTALQVFLASQRFEEGEYEMLKPYDQNSWVKVTT